MNKDRGIELFSGAPDRLKRCVIEIQSIYAPKIRICIHVRADLCGAEPELPDAAFQFGRGELRILHWNGCKAGGGRRMMPKSLRDVVVWAARRTGVLGVVCGGA